MRARTPALLARTLLKSDIGQTASKLITHVERALNAFQAWPEEFEVLQWEPNFDRQRFLAEHFMFAEVRGTWDFDMHGPFLENSYFGRPLPLVNSQGELYTLLNPDWALSRNATPIQQALALEFMFFMQGSRNPDFHLIMNSPSSAGFVPYRGQIPITRDGFEQESRRQLRNINARHTSNLRYGMNDSIEMFVERMYANINRPFASRPYVPAALRTFWHETLEDARQGLISPHEAALRLQDYAVRLVP